MLPLSHLQLLAAGRVQHGSHQASDRDWEMFGTEECGMEYVGDGG